jgi:uncharacterized phage protein (TIGR01671 family)
MREIKFRAFSKKFGGMIYPYDTKYRISVDISGCGIHSVWEDARDDEAVPIMQYIGRKDKCGVDVYEGDIIMDRSHKYASAKYEVKYNNCGFFGLSKDSDDWGPYTLNLQVNEGKPVIEVIGNIYENPELLTP